MATVVTSANIKAHWEPLIGEVDMGSQDTGLAHGFYDPETKTVFLIADHIEAGQEMAVAAHELMHKHGKAVLGERGWRQLHETLGTWADKPEGSLERQVYDEAVRRVDASRPAGADAASYSSEELFPYAVQVAMELGVEHTAMRPITTVQGWLARVRVAMRGAWDRLTNRPELFDSQDLVDLAFAVAQRENPAYASEFDEPSAPVSPGSGITAQQMQRIVDKALEVVGHEGPVEQHGLGVRGGGYARYNLADAGAGEFEKCGDHVGYATVAGLARCCAPGTMAPEGSVLRGLGWQGASMSALGKALLVKGHRT